MKRNVTELEQKLIEDGWYLALKRYHGKKAEKTLCYEYHKTADLRHNETKFDQFIRLDVKREKVVKYVHELSKKPHNDIHDSFLYALGFYHIDTSINVTKMKCSSNLPINMYKVKLFKRAKMQKPYFWAKEKFDGKGNLLQVNFIKCGFLNHTRTKLKRRTK